MSNRAGPAGSALSCAQKSPGGECRRGIVSVDKVLNFTAEGFYSISTMEKVLVITAHLAFLWTFLLFDSAPRVHRKTVPFF